MKTFLRWPGLIPGAVLLFALGLFPALATPPPLPEAAPAAPVETRTLKVILPSPASVEPDFELVVLRGERLNGTTNWTEVARAKQTGQTNTFAVEVPSRSQTWFWAAYESDPLTGSNAPPSAAVSLRRPLLSEGAVLRLQ